jgi:hypothetical protein
MPILDFPPSPSPGQIYDNSTSGQYRWNGYAWDRITAYLVPTTIAARSIVMWHGSTEDMPDGFKLCDGSNGTPDLRDRFIPLPDSSFVIFIMKVD